MAPLTLISDNDRDFESESSSDTERNNEGEAWHDRNARLLHRFLMVDTTVHLANPVAVTYF